MIINGEEISLQKDITVKDMLHSLNIDPKKVVVEVDLEIIDRSDFDKKKLDSHSKIEIVRFVGGG